MLGRRQTVLKNDTGPTGGRQLELLREGDHPCDNVSHPVTPLASGIVIAATPVRRRAEVPLSAGKYVQWQDLFIVVDDGSIPLAQYDAIEAAMKDQARACPSGIGCLVILPPGAKPPPDDVKLRVKNLLNSFGSQLTCLGYLIEGTGFKAVAARAALVGMKIFMTRPYPVYVETSMSAVLQKMLPHLTKGRATTDVERIGATIAESRARASAARA